MSFDWTDLSFDVNGNSRVACHWSKIGLATETYTQAVKRTNKLGGTLKGFLCVCDAGRYSCVPYVRY